MVDAVGGVIEFWGFKRHMGRVWMLLYLNTEPLPAITLGERLSMSAGAVSMTVNDLLKWGVIRKTWMPGERRDYYEPETSIWKMVSRVFRERELGQIREAIEAFEGGLAELSTQRKAASGDDVARLDFVTARIENLLALARIAENLLRAILSGESVDALPLKNFVFGRDDNE